MLMANVLFMVAGLFLGVAFQGGMFLFLIPFPFFDGAGLNETSDMLRVYAYFNAKNNLISLVLPFVYIGMGVFSLRKQRGSVYGDE